MFKLPQWHARPIILRLSVPVYAVLIAVLLSCNGVEQSDQSKTSSRPSTLVGEYPMEVRPWPLVAGDTFDVYYDASHPDHKLPPGDHYETTVVFWTANGIFMAIDTLKRIDENTVFATRFPLPPDCFYTLISIKPPGINIESESLMVAVHKDGQAPIHTIPFMISRGGMGNDVAILFAEDEQLFPYEFERWAALLLHRLKQQMSGADNQALITALAADLNNRHTQLRDSLDAAQTFDALATLAAAGAFTGDWTACAAMLETLQQHINDSRPMYVRARELTTVNLLGKLFEFARFTRGRHAARAQAAGADMVDSTLARLFNFGGTLPGGKMTQGIIRNLSMQPDSVPDEFVDRLRRGMIESIPALLAEMSDCDLIVDDQLPGLYLAECRSLNVEADVVQIERCITNFEGYFNHGADPQWCSPGMLVEPSYRSFCMQLARMYADKGAADRAAGFAHKALQRPLPTMSRLTAARAAFILGEIHLAACRPDSALRYCGIAAQLELLDADKLFKRIRAAGGLADAEPGTLEEVRDRYGREFLHAAEVLNIQLHTADGALIDLANTNGKPVYLLFSAESCGICAEQFPEVARAINETDPAATIVMITREPTAKVRAHYGAFIQHVTLDRNIEYQSNVQAMPTVKIVVDGMVEQTINGLGVHSAREFTQTAERYRNAAK